MLDRDKMALIRSDKSSICKERRKIPETCSVWRGERARGVYEKNGS